MELLNYSVPLSNPVVPTVQNLSEVVSILPRTVFPKIILGHFFYFTSQLTVADFIDTVTLTPYGYVQFGLTLYIEAVDKTKTVWLDIGMPTQIGQAVWYTAPIAVPANTQMLFHFANLKTSAASKLMTQWFVARGLVY